MFALYSQWVSTVHGLTVNYPKDRKAHRPEVHRILPAPAVGLCGPGQCGAGGVETIGQVLVP